MADAVRHEIGVFGDQGQIGLNRLAKGDTYQPCTVIGGQLLGQRGADSGGAVPQKLLTVVNGADQLLQRCAAPYVFQPHVADGVDDIFPAAVEEGCGQPVIQLVLHGFIVAGLRDHIVLQRQHQRIGASLIQ